MTWKQQRKTLERHLSVAGLETPLNKAVQAALHRIDGLETTVERLQEHSKIVVPKDHVEAYLESGCWGCGKDFP